MNKEFMNKALTIRQQRFCEGVAEGMTGAEAYIKAGAKVSAAVAKVGASKWLTRGNIKARIVELRTPQTKKALATLEEKRAFLAEIWRTPIGEIGPESPLCQEFTRVQVGGGDCGKLRRGQAPSGNEISGPPVYHIRIKGCDKLRAIELDSKLAGHFAPAEVVVESGPSQLDSIRERAKYVVSALSRAAELRRNRQPIVLGCQSGNGNGGSPPADNGHHPQPAGLSRWGTLPAPR